MATPTQSPGPSRRLPTVDDALALIRQKTGIHGETLLEVFMFVYSVASDGEKQQMLRFAYENRPEWDV